MSIRDLDKEKLVEMSMVDIVFALLKEGNKQPKPYQELLNEVVDIKGFSKEQKLEAMPRLYTEINIDGRFNGLGDNTWGLRSWYPVEQVEEIVITDLKKKKPKKKKAVDDDYLDDDYLDEDILDEDELLLDDDDDLDDDIDDDIDSIDDLDDDLDESVDEVDDIVIDDDDDDLPLEEDDEVDSDEEDDDL